VGFCAPEVAKDGPSVVSDLYTIARSIAVLATEFKGYQSKYKYSLPTPDQEPVYAKYESLYRFLLKGTHENPNMRFQSADEMAEQLLGVLREVVAQDTGVAKPGDSTVFNLDTLALLDLQSRSIDSLDMDSLPSLKRDPQDPATQFILTNMSSDPRKQTVFFQSAMEQFPDSIEAMLGMIKNQIRVAQYQEAEQLLKKVEEHDAFDWRVLWYRGLSFLAQGHFVDASEAFNNCYQELPGELAPKLGIAISSEKAGNTQRAVALYDAVSRTDPSYATAAFGLARGLAGQGKRDDAVNALARIRQTSSLYGEAQKETARILIAEKPSAPGTSELERAAKAIEALALEGQERLELVKEILGTALNLVTLRQLAPTNSVTLLGQTLESDSLRLGLEKAYRDMARLETNPAEKIRLVDQANQVRPRTLF
jgi:serine/threonine-protein kinase PknG